MAKIVQINSGSLTLRLSTLGGTVLRYEYDGDALLRPASDDAKAGASACFPMVPLCNRISENLLRFEGAEFVVDANCPPEPLYLHGEGWLADWTIADQGADFVELMMKYDGPRLPHHFEARQKFVLDDNGLQMSMSVRNTGDTRLPFGLGWHPFFPLTSKTTLTFDAQQFWCEGPDHLSEKAEPLSAPYDFRSGAPIPTQWINNAFEGWTGSARIVWQDRGLAMEINASPIFNAVQLYRPITGEDEFFFAFEPMSHLPSIGGMYALEKYECLAGTLTLQPQRLPAVSK